MSEMKKVIIALAALLALLSCGGDAEPGLQTGDLVFVAIPTDSSLDDTMAGAIAEATGSGKGLDYIHVAIVEVQQDSVWIIDATDNRGVSRHPVTDFIADFTLPDGTLPVFDVRRLKDNGAAGSYVEVAKKYIGRGYDLYFLPDNDEKYCSELVYDTYRNADGSPLFASAPMNFRGPAGEYPQYWTQLFSTIGAEIPQGVEGTNPQDMQKSDLLCPVDVDILRWNSTP